MKERKKNSLFQYFFILSHAVAAVSKPETATACVARRAPHHRLVFAECSDCFAEVSLNNNKRSN
jgi:hypothetical protein